MRLHDVIQNFNPSWFASVMGTVVIPLALGFGDLPFKMFLVTFFVILSVIMFLAALVPWALKFIFYPDKTRRISIIPWRQTSFPQCLSLWFSFRSFFSGIPMDSSLPPLPGPWLSGSGGWALPEFTSWDLSSSRIFRNKQIQLAHSNFGWFIPPVSKIIITLAGLELAGFFPGAAEIIFCISMVSFGVGFFLFLFVGAVVYHRYVYHELPISSGNHSGIFHSLRQDRHSIQLGLFRLVVRHGNPCHHFLLAQTGSSLRSFLVGLYLPLRRRPEDNELLLPILFL